MRDRLLAVALVWSLLILTAWVAEPYVGRFLPTEAAPRAVAPRGDLAGREQAAIELFRRASPSVVQVLVEPNRQDVATRGAAGRDSANRNAAGRGATEPQGDEEADEDSRASEPPSGSGFVWDGAGHIVTNHHVVESGRPITVRLADGRELPATLVGTARNYDLAVLRLEGAPPLPPIPIGSSADLEVGQATFTIGNPFGLGQAMSTGIVSARQRRVPTEDAHDLTDVIQTDAAINPGNSGGPLLDSSGRLIGVTTALLSESGSSSGVGFAIPVDLVNRLVPQLIRNGRLPSSGIGVVAGDDRTAARLGVQGLVVVRTLPGSPAARAGLVGADLAARKAGDVIVGANGRPVRAPSDLKSVLERLEVGQPVELRVARGGKTRVVRVDTADVSEPGDAGPASL